MPMLGWWPVVEGDALPKQIRFKRVNLRQWLRKYGFGHDFRLTGSSLHFHGFAIKFSIKIFKVHSAGTRDI